MTEKSKLRPVSISMPVDLSIQARVEAAKCDMSRSAFVVRAVEKAIQESRQQSGDQQSSGRGEPQN